MNRIRVAVGIVIVTLLLGVAGSGWADSWRPPTTEVTSSANGRFRVTVVPRPLSDTLSYWKDKTKGVEPAGQRADDTQVTPVARVERLIGADEWQLVWRKPLANEVGPTDVLLADDGSFLVTFDNWHSVGYGDNVVVIYDHHGNLVRKLSLEQILPEAYVLHLPRSVSSRHWGRGHRLVESDTQIELQVVEPGHEEDAKPKHIPVRIRLLDGEVIPPTGEAWQSALAKAVELESKRMAAWRALQKTRVAPVLPPQSNGTTAWRTYMFELRDRLGKPEEGFPGLMVAVPGDKEWGGSDAQDVALWIENFDASEEGADKRVIFASPTSDELARVLAKALRARAAGSMKGLEIVFVGTEAEGMQVTEAARMSGASVLAIDRAKPFPGGEPLPDVPPDYWFEGIY